MEPAADLPLTAADEAIRRGCPALWACLSPLGRRLRIPANFLPYQSAEARGKPFNATIGQITDGRGRAVPLPSMAAAVAGLDEEARSRAFLYSPVEGFPDLRRLWRERQRRGVPEDLPSSLPLVTAGPVQALAILAELLAGEGSAVVLPDEVPPEYAATFTLRSGARTASLAELADGEAALVVVGGEKTAGWEGEGVGARVLLTTLADASARRPLAVIVDDGVLGRNGGQGGADSGGRSAFWDLLALHPNLVPFKVDDAGPELGAATHGVGFVTLPFPPESELAQAFESKVKTLLRALVGSPPAFAQALLLDAMHGALQGRSA
jgi:hypothetical protein